MQNICVWFRNDLRAHDNPALYHACKIKDAQISALFCINIKQWQSHHWGHNKIGFMLRSVIELKKELDKLNIPLKIIETDYFKDIHKDISSFCKKNKINAIFYNKEYEVNELSRDEKVVVSLDKINVTVKKFEDQTIVPVSTVKTGKSTPFTVFTPFRKAWYNWIDSNGIKPFPKPAKRPNNNTIKADKLKTYSEFTKSNIQDLWKTGETSAKKALSSFCEQRIFDYQSKRDFPNIDITSKISPYLANGTLSAKECFVAAFSANKGKFSSGNKDVVCWISELAWRDFYRNILVSFPKVCRNQNFNNKYNSIPWNNSKKHLKAWKEGRTGIPIVDAAIHSMLQTGWMHNRLRMVVAMFLTKNLLIDWREGEKFFMQHLIDADFASNNGGWQWSASTGTDAAPYFRIFNPVSQSEKFDIDGNFIKKYCPELKDLDKKKIHAPFLHLTTKELKQINYPKNIVDLGESRKQAIEAFKGL